mgnify:CR=1 FL=1
MTGKDGDDAVIKGVGAVVALGSLYFLAMARLPQALLVIPGGIVAGAGAMLLRLDVDAHRWWGRRFLAAGVLVVVVFFLLGGLIGADVEQRRFLHAWDVHGQQVSDATRHPWAAVLLGWGFLSVGTGVVLWGRACS